MNSMESTKDIVIFDFCETLCNFQTADAFVDYVRSKIGSAKIQKKENLNLFLRRTRIASIAELLTFHKLSILKRLKLWQLVGVKESVVTELALGYYRDVVRPNLIGRTLDILKEYHNKDCLVYLISGGYEQYLRFFVEEFRIDNLISSKIAFSDGCCTGKLEGVDCVCNNKVKLLKVNLGNKRNRIIASYSDSKSDIPILSIADQPFVVSRSPQLWAVKKKFNEIIW